MALSCAPSTGKATSSSLFRRARAPLPGRG